MKILVTGISGFLGSALVKMFQAFPNIELYGLSSSLSGFDYKGVQRIYKYDELDTYDDFNVVIHLAGIAHDVSGNSTYENYYDVNVVLTKQIFDKYLNSKCEKFIFLSTSKVYGENVNFVNEQDELMPKTDYAKTKIECEKYIKSKQNDRSVYILRPAMIHGEGNKGNFNTLHKLLKFLGFNPFSRFNNLKSFLSLENFNFLIKAIVENKIQPGVYNIADNKPLSLAMTTNLFCDRKFISVPKIVFKVIALICHFFKLRFFNINVYEKIFENFTISTEKLIKQGIDFPISSHLGLRKTINYFNKNKSLKGILEIPEKFSCEVSIITPVYNSENYLDEMIKSVLNQTFTNWELIMVDDNSFDKSIDVIKKYVNKKYNIHLIKNSSNIGPALSRNKAIKVANGRFIAFLDSDDIWTPNKLEDQIAFMKEKNIAFSHSSYGFIDEKSNLKYRIFNVSKYPIKYENLLKKNEVSCLTAVYDVSIIGKNYMPNLRLAEDYSLWLKIVKSGFHSHPINKILGFYRQRKDSVTSKKFSLIYSHWKFLYFIHGLSFFSSLYYLSCWAFNGFKKYYLK